MELLMNQVENKSCIALGNRYYLVFYIASHWRWKRRKFTFDESSIAFLTYSHHLYGFIVSYLEDSEFEK